MMVPLQTVALALAGILLLILSIVWSHLVRQGRVGVPCVALSNLGACGARIGQRQQWVVPRQWHPWLAGRSRSKDHERLLGGLRERVMITLLP